MKAISYYLKLVRWPNLLVIALTQWLFYICINRQLLMWTPFDEIFSITVVICVLCAAAGYIINDYFDVAIDQINKPDKMILGKYITPKMGKSVYIFMLIITEILSIYCDTQWASFWITAMTTAINILLYFYSKYWKKSFFIGNFVVALVTSAPILYCFLPIYFKSFLVSELWMWLCIIYFYFSFLTCLIREIVKDLEDRAGDQALGANTLAIALGEKKSKFVVTIFTVLLVLPVTYFGYVFYTMQIWLFAVYIIALLVFPIVYFLISFLNAKNPKDYHQASTQLKIIMLLGIFFLIFLRLVAYSFTSLFI
ncbi:geranylgeranylglycerol-phosphate geranylgeranyltransferase [Rhizosphaericola mali]|uniref:Ubiquinone biosynthesis protein UbiA n=1 Tax=Rhizosphaericola mali TaxID=2545455 RepID=A0A5P2G2Z7_9BACT|nr:geranylgeranylglycerol-phosphate geranylgeranyltransferase [Rhizosphaericola mali]QES90176.1 hypothetical protein E0W69_016475 [Rhizosphaericola mali]